MDWKICETLKFSSVLNYTMRNFTHRQNGYHNYIDEPWYRLSVSWDHPGYGSSVYIEAERRLRETAYNHNRYYTDTIITFGAQQIFLLKYLIGVTAKYEHLEYERFGRSDEVLSVSPRFEYAFKDRFKLILMTKYSIRSSNADLSEYEAFHTGLSVQYRL